MKKITSIIVCLILIVGLSSCSKDRQYDKRALESEVYEEWFKDISYSADSFNTYKDSASHYRGYLPSVIDESVLRINIVSAEDIKDSQFYKININFASPSNVSGFFSSFASDLKSYFNKEENKAKLDFVNGEIESAWSIAYTPGESDIKTASDGERFVLYTVYLPVRIEEYVNQKSSVTLMLDTYIAVPVAYGVTIYKEPTSESSNDGILLNVDNVYNNIKEIVFKLNEGLLK